jgi:hypothetical protein
MISEYELMFPKFIQTELELQVFDFLVDAIGTMEFDPTKFDKIQSVK